MDPAIERCREWVGREEERRDVVTAAPLVALSALLDREDPAPRPGDAAPPLAHWLYFLPDYRQSAAGPDGHAARGEFLPPVPLARRMWAGSRLEFLRPLVVGAEVTRRSRIASVAPKQGRSGALVFVTVRHEVSDAGGLVLADEHDIVYRGEGGGAPVPVPAPTGEAWRREIHPDPLLLFRYSAVTFNGHRIHYDRPYATEVEGYPGLVVHGPLVATLLVDLLRRHEPAATLKAYTFRALRPLFDTASFTTCGLPDASGRSARLWTRDAQGAVTMEANASWQC
ncbi:MAG TPA: MaoC family dehydratase N-terminal domain-containing protein [Gemmatimonadales bacterium]|nr:MaoC family dehydratase N-terminal domain-containing protein [Gemmatimonadales bacterium]